MKKIHIITNTKHIYSFITSYYENTTVEMIDSTVELVTVNGQIQTSKDILVIIEDACITPLFYKYLLSRSDLSSQVFILLTNINQQEINYEHGALTSIYKWPLEYIQVTAAITAWLSERETVEKSIGIKPVLDFQLANIAGYQKKIMVPTISGFELLPIFDIVYCTSAINYTTIWLKTRHKLLVAKTLGEFEKILSPYNFFRIHNSHLVNLAYIKSYKKGKGGLVVLTDGTEVEVSTRRKEEFIAKVSTL